MYRHNLCEGGIPFWGFHDLISEVLVSQGKFEDASALLKDEKNNLWNAYWEDKRAHPERITILIYIVASWTSAAHTLRTLKSWGDLSVRLSILNLGLRPFSDTVDRPETQFPLARTQFTRHYLTSDGGLSLTAPPKTTAIFYKAKSRKVIF
ncbi:hypothetical protein ASPVEDRAFT_83422 [Aspergillus versicolor CBS 583.65]|uniref:Uncharacterized protein n=1 Tax=Aspergillus versicolor CBS 583.65 TaxID=1036611 RepID=A0A1L9PK39_ASPVE|nr:uncharacterized protein ASPVEDRAFT_83422 [Aspergillus versicolor CBS 583.65]OJJ01900.1 hypothetical protein ASPVEDRAFT_83422 [Aspergillus versicolor CBS 583.65]